MSGTACVRHKRFDPSCLTGRKDTAERAVGLLPSGLFGFSHLGKMLRRKPVEVETSTSFKCQQGKSS